MAGSDRPGGEAWSATGLAPIVRGRGANRTSDRIFAELEAAICDLRLEPGRLLSETELAGRLGVSRTPLREAIGRLVDVGLVDVTPQVGTRVAMIRASAVEEARFIREALEIAAYRDAAALPHRDVGRMRGLVQLQESAARTRDLEAFFAADEAMHEQVYVLGGHFGAWQAVRRIKPQLDRVRRLGLTDAGLLDTLIAEHAGIVDGLESGDTEAGVAHLRTHCRRVLTTLPALRVSHEHYFTGT
ncbi:GntR family transcriptional regulator [Actinophytocola oryzae]|nr:GntR family transcriptional regulator [Actinophytocola oryzae]